MMLMRKWKQEKGEIWIVDNLLLCDSVAIVSDNHEK
jgi:hypothetical protein